MFQSPHQGNDVALREQLVLINEAKLEQREMALNLQSQMDQHAAQVQKDKADLLKLKEEVEEMIKNHYFVAGPIQNMTVMTTTSAGGVQSTPKKPQPQPNIFSTPTPTHIFPSPQVDPSPSPLPTPQVNPPGNPHQFVLLGQHTIENGPDGVVDSASSLLADLDHAKNLLAVHYERERELSLQVNLKKLKKTAKMVQNQYDETVRAIQYLQTQEAAFQTHIQIVHKEAQDEFLKWKQFNGLGFVGDGNLIDFGLKHARSKFEVLQLLGMSQRLNDSNSYHEIEGIFQLENDQVDERFPRPRRLVAMMLQQAVFEVNNDGSLGGELKLSFHTPQIPHQLQQQQQLSSSQQQPTPSLFLKTMAISPLPTSTPSSLPGQSSPTPISPFHSIQAPPLLKKFTIVTTIDPKFSAIILEKSDKAFDNEYKIGAINLCDELGLVGDAARIVFRAYSTPIPNPFHGGFVGGFGAPISTGNSGGGLGGISNPFSQSNPTTTGIVMSGPGGVFNPSLFHFAAGPTPDPSTNAKVKLCRELKLNPINANRVMLQNETQITPQYVKDRCGILSIHPMDSSESNQFFSAYPTLDLFYQTDLWTKLVQSKQYEKKQLLDHFLLPALQNQSDWDSKGSHRVEIIISAPQLGFSYYTSSYSFTNLLSFLIQPHQWWQSNRTSHSRFVTHRHPKSGSGSTQFSPLFQDDWAPQYDSGLIPHLTSDLKLFLSTNTINNGDWVQFHGPGSLLPEVATDEVTRNHPWGTASGFIVTLGMLCPPDQKGDFTCQQHHPGAHNHGNTMNAPYLISIRWE